MDEFAKYIMEQYNIKIISGGINIEEGYYYIFQLSTQQQNRLYNLENYEIEEFVLKAKMVIVEKTMIPLGQINGTYEFSYGQLRLAGSKEFIDLMLHQLFLL